MSQSRALALGPVDRIIKLIGARIRELREEMGYSVAQLAAAIPAEHSTVNSIESGRHGVSLRTLIVIAGHLRCEESDLLTFPGVSIRHEIHDLTRNASRAALLDIRAYAEQRVKADMEQQPTRSRRNG